MLVLFLFSVRGWREGRIGVFNTNFYFGNRLYSPRCFSRSVNFPLDNDLRREPQGPVPRRKHLYKGRGWKRQIGFFPWPVRGMRSVLSCLFTRRSGNERQMMVFPSIPHQGMLWRTVLCWHGRNTIGFLSVWSSAKSFPPPPSEETESFVPWWWTRSVRLSPYPVIFDLIRRVDLYQLLSLSHGLSLFWSYKANRF